MKIISVKALCPQIAFDHTILLDDFSYELKCGPEFEKEEKVLMPIQEDNGKDGGKKGCAVLLIATILFIVYLLLA